MDSEPGVCWLCEQPASLVCPRCTAAQYCSTECAEDDLQEHQEECEESPSSERPCAYCGRLQRHLFYCRYCHLVAYCSASCCQLDARLHLPACLAGRDAILRAANRLTHGAPQFRLPCYFGDGPHALNLLKGLDPTGEEPFRLLQLSAQLPHLLKTAAAAAGSRRPLAVTLASDSPHQLARACLLLHLLTGGAAPAHAIQIMYSLQLETETAQLLHTALEQLVSATYSQLLQQLPWLQLQRAALSHCQEVWRAWLHAMQDVGCLQRMLACRAAVLQSEPARSQLQRYLTPLPARQQRAARQLLHQHGCLLSGEVAHAAAAANVTLLALSPRYQQYQQQFSDLQLGAQPPDWLDAAGDAATVYVPAPPPGPLADWDAAEVRRALGDDIDIISGCRQLAEDCAAALAERAAAGRLSVRLVQFEKLEQLDEQLSELRFERIFTADVTDRLGLYSVLEMCELLLSTASRSLILTCHRRWAELSPPAGTTISALRGGGSMAWDRQLDTERFRLTAYLQAERLAYTAAARDKDVLDTRLPMPTTLEVATFGTLLLTQPGRAQPTVAPHRQRQAPRAASAGDPSLRLLEWRRDPEGVRRMQAEARAQLVGEQPAAVAVAEGSPPGPQYRGPGRYERQLQQPRPARLSSPLYGSLRRISRRPPTAAVPPPSPLQRLPSPTLYENLPTAMLSPRPPPTPVHRAATLPLGGSLRRRPSPVAVQEPLYETVAAVMDRRTMLPSPPATDPGMFRRSASLRTSGKPVPLPRQRLFSMSQVPSPSQRQARMLLGSPLPPENGRFLPSGQLTGYTSTDQPLSTSGAPPRAQGRFRGSLSLPFNRLQLAEANGSSPLSPAVSPHAEALQTPEGRRRLVQTFAFPATPRSESVYGTLPRRSASLSMPRRPVRVGSSAADWSTVNGRLASPASSPMSRERIGSDGQITNRARPGTLTLPLAKQQQIQLNGAKHMAASTADMSPRSVMTLPAVEGKTIPGIQGQGDNSRDSADGQVTSMQSPADIDRMTQRREPKNIADWLREDKDRQREFQQEAGASEGGGQWSRQEKPPPAAARNFTVGSESSPAPTRPGSITPKAPASASEAAAQRRSKFRAHEGRSAERLLASLERDWSLDVPESKPESEPEPEPEPQTIAELGVRGTVAEWLLDRLLRDELQRLANSWLETSVIEQLQHSASSEEVAKSGEPAPDGKPAQDANSAETEAKAKSSDSEPEKSSSLDEGYSSLAPQAAAVETPAPRAGISGPFDINAQEVGRLQSPRFAEVDTPAPRSVTREQLFSDIQQYRSPVTGQPLVSLGSSEEHSTPIQHSLYSSSVFIPSPEQRIVIPIPSESLVIQPPAIRVPCEGDSNDKHTTGQTFLAAPQETRPPAPKSDSPRLNTPDSEEVVVSERPSSPLAARGQNAESDGSRAQSHSPRPAADLAAEQITTPPQAPVDPGQALSQRRDRLMARAATGRPNQQTNNLPTIHPEAPTPRTETQSAEEATVRAANGSAQKAEVPEDGSPSAPSSGGTEETAQTKYMTSATIVPSPPARPSLGKQMLWKIPLLEKKNDDGQGRNGTDQDVNREEDVKSQAVPQTSSEAAGSVVMREKPTTPNSATKRTSLKLSMDKEYYEMKNKLSTTNSGAPERRRSRPLTMEAEYREMQLKLQPPGEVDSPPPLSEGQLVRTGSVRQRAALFSQRPARAAEDAETAATHAQLTVRLRGSPTPSPGATGPLALTGGVNAAGHCGAATKTALCPESAL